MDVAKMTKRVQPIKPDGYDDELSGDWNDVPEWAIRRINFLEHTIEFNDRGRCPNMDETCPVTNGHPEGDMSCQSIKHCYPYLCDGSCGKCNEIWVTDKERKQIIEDRLNGKC
jgi:hypothetical protein